MLIKELFSFHHNLLSRNHSRIPFKTFSRLNFFLNNIGNDVEFDSNHEPCLLIFKRENNLFARLTPDTSLDINRLEDF